MSMLLGTAIGVRTREEVVLASEKRLTYDGFVLSRNVKKVFLITTHVGVGFAGLMGDINVSKRMLEMEAKYCKPQHGSDTGVRGLAKLLSVVLYSYKLVPTLTEIIVGGYDENGP